MKYSECSSAKAGGNLGWFPRGKMEGKFQDVAFSTPEKECSQPFKGANGNVFFLSQPSFPAFHFWMVSTLPSFRASFVVEPRAYLRSSWRGIPLVFLFGNCSFLD